VGTSRLTSTIRVACLSLVQLPRPLCLRAPFSASSRVPPFACITMDQRSLAQAALKHAQSQQRAIDSLRGPPHFSDPSSRWIGAQNPHEPPQPFFQDRNITLSRPALLRDYQGDPAAYPLRGTNPVELSDTRPHTAPCAAPWRGIWTGGGC
jgi:hypothetical protein